MRPKNIVVIGGGIAGLVFSNLIKRRFPEWHVILMEREPETGGCGRGAHIELDGRICHYPLGATMLGEMPIEVFRETGLEDVLPVYAPVHPNTYHFVGDAEPVIYYRESKRFAREVLEKCGERGDYDAYEEDAGAVVSALQQLRAEGIVPTEELLEAAVGKTLTDLFIRGSAWDLADHYFTSEKVKVIATKDTMEANPVSLRSPYSAASIVMSDCGSVLGGRWGYCLDGIPGLIQKLTEITKRIGVEILTNCQVHEVRPKHGEMTGTHEGRFLLHSADEFVFATDALTAARMMGDTDLLRQLDGKSYQGSSGKLITIWRKPVRWRHDTGEAGYDSALKFVLHNRTLEELDSGANLSRDSNRDYIPGYAEIYSEGPGLRALGQERGYDTIMLFFKHLTFNKTGAELPEVHEAMRQLLLAQTRNPEDLAWSELLTPKDIKNHFHAPQGCIALTEKIGGQVFFQRTYSSDPQEDFFRLGDHENVHGCSGSWYDGGSINGTNAYLLDRFFGRRYSK